MKNLIKFELRKILTKRFAVISIAAILLLSLILSFSTLHSMYAFDGNGTEETGKAAVEIDKQIALKYEGKLTDNKVQQMMSEFKPTQDLHGMNAKYIYQNALQSSVFSHFADIDGSWNGLSVADVFGDKEIKVGYVNGWLSTSQNMAKIFIVLSLVIILLIAPVFSGEYGGVDNIILTSKYGKTKCATAKVLASLLSAVFITTLVVIFNLLIAVAIYGTEGLDCSILFAPIDFLEGYIPFNITCGTVLKYQILLAFMSAISVTGIVLILSAVCKSQMIAFVISAAIYVIPIMLPISETSALYRIIVLMPLFYSQYISIMSVEQMHNGMLYAVWSIPVAIALVVIGSIISHMVIFYAALVSLDPSVYEAAKIDGASEMQILFKIKMPLIKDIVLLTLTMCLTGALRGFDIPFLLTSGGPGNASELMSTYMYKKAFSSNQYGYGSTLAVFIIIESILVVYILRKIFTSKEQKEEKRIEKERIRRNRRGNH